MSDEWTPRTEPRTDEYYAAFDRWLAAHDAEKDAEIARLRQNVIDLVFPAHFHDTGQTIVHDLRARLEAAEALLTEKDRQIQGWSTSAVETNNRLAEAEATILKALRVGTGSDGWVDRREAMLDTLVAYSTPERTTNTSTEGAS